MHVTEKVPSLRYSTQHCLSVAKWKVCSTRISANKDNFMTCDVLGERVARHDDRAPSIGNLDRQMFFQPCRKPGMRTRDQKVLPLSRALVRSTTKTLSAKTPPSESNRTDAHRRLVESMWKQEAIFITQTAHTQCPSKLTLHSNGILTVIKQSNVRTARIPLLPRDITP